MAPKLFDDRSLIDKSGHRKYLTEAERERFLAATSSLPAQPRCLCRLLYYTGVRIGEAVEIQSNHISLEEMSVTVRTEKQGKDQNGDPIIRFRDVPLPPELVYSLEMVFDLRQLQKSKRGRLPEPVRLWPVTVRTAQRYVRQAMDAAGIRGPHANARGLRHSFGTHAVIKNVPLRVISETMGHSSLEVTMIYTTVVGGERRETIGRMWS